MMTLLMVIRILFTIISLGYVVIFISYLLKHPFQNSFTRLMVGDVNRNSLFYKTHQQVLDHKLQQVYWANLIFIILFTVCLWSYTVKMQLILGLISLVAFLGLSIVDYSYKRLLKQMGSEA